MDPYLPREARAAFLLFAPVAFFEPLQRLMRTILRKTAHSEMDRAQRMMGPSQEVARLGNLEKLQSFIEKWLSEQFQLAEVKLVMNGGDPTNLGQRASDDLFEIKSSGHLAGTLRVKRHGAMLSGETAAALEFLCEQLPGALDLCRLVEEKLLLGRELAEHERPDALGPKAGHISQTW